MLFELNCNNKLDTFLTLLKLHPDYRFYLVPLKISPLDYGNRESYEKGCCTTAQFQRRLLLCRNQIRFPLGMKRRISPLWRSTEPLSHEV